MKLIDQQQPRGLHVEAMKSNPAAATFEVSLANARSLSELGRHILPPAERPDHGEIHYTTTGEAIREWAHDPHGKRKFAFLSSAYGIPAEELPEVLHDMGMDEYVQAKREGRLIGMVSTQVSKPTYYFMSNALILGHLNREYGIPTALMVGTYSSDLFYPNNSDKTGAFGTVEFPIGIDPNGRLSTIKIKVSPVGLRKADGSIKPISTINEASGQKCSDIMVRVSTAADGKDKSYPTGRDGNKQVPVTTEDAEFFTKAALGIHIPQEGISLTDFYQAMWVATIQRLRESGDLPSEKEMPMFFVSAEQMYSVLPQRANPPQETIRTLSGIDMTRDKNLTRLQNGPVVRRDNEVMDPRWYYPGQYTWPDYYLECSSCGGGYFVEKLARADRLLEQHGLPTPEVRLPDKEVPEMEAYAIHPSGRHIDMMSVRQEQDRATLPVLTEIKEVQAQMTMMTNDGQSLLSKEVGRRKICMLQESMNEIKYGIHRELVTRVTDGHAEIRKHTSEHDLVIPEVIAATYRELLQGAREAATSDEVQDAIRHARISSHL